MYYMARKLTSLDGIGYSLEILQYDGSLRRNWCHWRMIVAIVKLAGSFIDVAALRMVTW